MTVVATEINPWEIREEAFPRHGTDDDKLRFCLHYAILAPSGHNTQPWLFTVRNGLATIYADRTRALPVVDPHDRELIISCGAALFHLRAALTHFGYQPVVERVPDSADPDQLATVRLGPEALVNVSNRTRFRAMLTRRTTRVAFQDQPVPISALEDMRQAAAEEGAWLTIVTHDAAKQQLAELIAEGDRRQMANPAFRRELAAWMHPLRGKTRDGLSSYGSGMNSLLDPLTPVAAAVVRTFNLGKGQAAKNKALAIGSPTLVVIGTEEDTPTAWLAAGEALAKVLLIATAMGLRASFLNQPIEVAKLRPRVTEIVERSGHPQLLLRLGYGPQRRPAARRPVRDVLRMDEQLIQ